MKYFSLLVCIFFFGCASSLTRISTQEQPVTSNELLSRYLDRSGIWESMSCFVKVRLQVGDTTLAAKGTLLYMSPEKYSLSFAKPYNQVIGDIYVTPTQLMYWGNGQTKLFFTDKDTVRIPELVPLSFPAWDPRDLLPMPVSGRTAGFQVMQEFQDSLNQPWIEGECGSASHLLKVDPAKAIIDYEQVVRNGVAPIQKMYSKYYSFHGWPIPTRVICKDETGRVKLTWSISNIELKSPSYTFDESETSH